MRDAPISTLIREAREGARHAFLTSEGGVRYGAAVWTRSGGIHRAGQYSSFNHSTNIHAEACALAIATAAGDPDVLALALVSSAATESPARPCGVCRQVIAEHAQRIGHPIEVIMATWDGTTVTRASIAELLPMTWEPRPSGRHAPWCEPDPPTGRHTRFGDHLVIRPGLLAIVWGQDAASGDALVKVKYELRRKLPHSYSEWHEYQRDLDVLDVGDRIASGDRMVFASPAACPCIPLAEATAAGFDRIWPLLDLLDCPVFVTGSHAIGAARVDSDIDIVIDGPSLPSTRGQLADRILQGIDFAPPTNSSTWDRLTRTFGDPATLLRAGRFCDTFMLRGSRGWSRMSLVWTGTPPGRCAHIDRARLLGSTLTEWRTGQVTAIEAIGKPSRWTLGCDGEVLSVHTWHKDGCLLKVGDVVSVRGLAPQGDPTTLVQFSPDRDAIQFPRGFPA